MVIRPLLAILGTASLLGACGNREPLTNLPVPDGGTSGPDTSRGTEADTNPVDAQCADGEASDGSGSCRGENGQPCEAGATCASGFCADGVCCDGACTGVCRSCNRAGHVGTCVPYPAGTDPQAECGQGEDVCKGTCDGAGSCVYPDHAVCCTDFMACNGRGSCGDFTPFACNTSGTAGSASAVVRAPNLE